ncbi:MAG: DUF58 domain-containing protein [Magnetospirillum gryphiswaldense]|nr:DUF58 domain-containing protein [Magnetospirillum gryphiswaldense]
MIPPRVLAQAQDLAARLPPLLVAAERVAASLAGGTHGRRRAGPGETFWQYRRAQPGDSAAAIDWRRSARGNGLYLRETEWSATQGFWLWCDASASMDWRSTPDLPEKRNRALLLNLALAALLLRLGERVAILGPGDAPSSGPGSLPRLAEQMASPWGDGVPHPLRPPRHGEVVLVSDFLMPPERIAQDVATLAAQGNGGHLIQVLDPAEETLPYSGRVRFVDTEDETELLARRAEDWRADYARRLAEHRDALTAIATAHGWSFATHRTDHPPQLALLALQARLAMPRSRRPT